MSRSFRVGVFIVSGVAMLTASVFLIGSRQFLFSRSYELSTTFKNVGGLMKGAEVRVGGIHRGAVKRIDLPAQPDGQLTVVLRMERSTDEVVRRDSIASIETEGLLGEKYIEVSFGSEGAPKVHDGDQIGGAAGVELADLMKKGSDMVGSLQEGAEQLKEIAVKINGGVGTMGALINDRKAYSQATLAATSFQENMEALKHNFLLRGFFNSRGYDNSAKLTEDAITTLPSGPYLARYSFDAAKVFDKVSSAKIAHGKVLTDAGRTLESKPFGVAVVVARHGMTGDADEIRTLTQAQAMTVRDYLVANFKMDDTRVKTMGVGKNAQVPADTGSIEVLIYPPGVKVPAASTRR